MSDEQKHNNPEIHRIDMIQNEARTNSGGYLKEEPNDAISYVAADHNYSKEEIVEQRSEARIDVDIKQENSEDISHKNDIKKKIMVEVQTEGECITKNHLIIFECKKCRPRLPFKNLVDFICHSVRKHQNTFQFYCKICSEIVKDSALADHFTNHSLVNLTLGHKSHDDHSSWFNDNSGSEMYDEATNNEVPLEVILNVSNGSTNIGKKDGEYDDNKKQIIRRSSRKRTKTRRRQAEMEETDIEEDTIPITNDLATPDPHSKSSVIADESATIITNKESDSINAVQSKTMNSKSTKKKNERKKSESSSTPKKKKKSVKQRRLCSHCGVTYNSSYALKLHSRVHTGEKPYKCPECGKAFSLSANLSRHLLIHTGEKPFLCTICGKSYNQAGSLKAHSFVHTDPENKNLKSRGNKKPMSCEFCGKMLSSRNALMVHIRVHTKEHPYECTTCPKKFSQISSLKSHMLSHTGLKPHKCPHCMKAFKFSESLRTHIRTHTGERPYKCALCERAFSGLSNYRRHMASHTGIKRFKCDDCGKQFTGRPSLRDHLNIHSGARPYSCPHCSSCFANKTTLAKHVSKHVNRN